ncbi:MAG: 2-C-methyl-D-erythritol 2,4-cyclodiphosphate synthase [Thiotrichaceae bacterium]|nr:2-C-methyl-D-erythritol 2,4-cyclodiphosphate synthase [Thiotrichaceae bacterium]PCI13151.1 MAG: 2-C-methyl-D-erythritol 2,4-cyclodiphosphate synthase [Thiotrichales bacterium]
MRIGHGFDAHRFTDDKDVVIIGGVSIPYEQGLEAHSDGDVLVHALCDALLGAAALGDIGQHFPDTDPDNKGIDSRILLRHIVALLNDKGYTLSNADITIIAQAPKMMRHIPEMRELLADDLQIAVERVNVKATTTEKMGYTGRGEGISTHAVVLLNESL